MLHSLTLLARKSSSLLDCISVLLCTVYACTTLGGRASRSHCSLVAVLLAHAARSWAVLVAALLLAQPADEGSRVSSGTLACANCDCFYLLRMMILLLRRTYLAPEYVITRTTTYALLVHLSLARLSAEKVQLAVRSQTGWDRLSWAGL